jgi:hypothetical protein
MSEIAIYPDLKINLCEDLDAYWVEIGRENAKYHIHPDGLEGASALGKCTYFRAYKEAGMPIPPVAGIKADKGPMLVGTMWHSSIIQPAFRAIYARKWQKLYPELVYGDEVYIETQLIPGRIVRSPIDGAIVTQPGFIEREVQYESFKGMGKFKHPDAKWVKIWDIKSASPIFAFHNYEIEGLSEEYEFQGLPYLKATGLPEMEFLFLNKANAHKFTLVLKWNDERWKALQQKRQRELLLADELRQNAKITHFSTDDFRYFTGDNDYDCRYCPLSETHEEVKPLKDPQLIFDKPCAEVCQRSRLTALRIFVTGTKWTRGSAFVTINRIDDDLIYCTNKGGTEYIDSIFRAVKMYKEGWVKGERV